MASDPELLDIISSICSDSAPDQVQRDDSETQNLLQLKTCVAAENISVTEINNVSKSSTLLSQSSSQQHSINILPVTNCASSINIQSTMTTNERACPEIDMALNTSQQLMKSAQPLSLLNQFASGTSTDAPQQTPSCVAAKPNAPRDLTTPPPQLSLPSVSPSSQKTPITILKDILDKIDIDNKIAEVDNSDSESECGNKSGTTDSDDSDSSSSESRVSALSGLSGWSGQEWNPLNMALGWIEKQIMSGVNPRNILSKLILKDSPVPEHFNDMVLWQVIADILAEPPRRPKLTAYNNISDVVHLLKTCNNIVVLTGAGVSVSCGIPDFRSRNGIYSRLAIDFPDLPNPQAMFDIAYFSQDPRPFYKFAREIYPGQFEPSPSHKFIKLLEKKGKLLRNYSQNIDTLERVAGITNVMECHGSFVTASCTNCKTKVMADAIRDDIFAQRIPVCKSCNDVDGDCQLPEVVRSGHNGKNSNLDFSNLVANGIMKPDIVFFGEGLPDAFHAAMASDKDKCDLLIVIGSSLKVRPVALIPNSIPECVPQILINREKLSQFNFDIDLLGDADIIVNHLCRMLGDDWAKICWSDEIMEQSASKPILVGNNTKGNDSFLDTDSTSNEISNPQSTGDSGFDSAPSPSSLHCPIKTSSYLDDNLTSNLKMDESSTSTQNAINSKDITDDDSSAAAFDNVPSVDEGQCELPGPTYADLLKHTAKAMNQNVLKTEAVTVSAVGDSLSSPTATPDNIASPKSNKTSFITQRYSSSDSSSDSDSDDASSSADNDSSVRGNRTTDRKQKVVYQLKKGEFMHYPPSSYIFPGAEVLRLSPHDEFLPNVEDKVETPQADTIEDTSEISGSANKMNLINDSYWKRKQTMPTSIEKPPCKRLK